MYKLYTDKKEMFECDISLSGASLKDATARLIIETENVNLLYKGTIGSKGNCKVPVHKLRGLLDESAKGKIKLEVIAEDTYFVPWESEFAVETSKSVTVEDDTPTLTETQHAVNLLKLLIKEDINMSNISVKRNRLNNIVATYIKENPINTSKRNQILGNVVKVLAKRK